MYSMTIWRWFVTWSPFVWPTAEAALKWHPHYSFHLALPSPLKKPVLPLSRLFLTLKANNSWQKYPLNLFFWVCGWVGIKTGWSYYSEGKVYTVWRAEVGEQFGWGRDQRSQPFGRSSASSCDMCTRSDTGSSSEFTDSRTHACAHIFVSLALTSIHCSVFGTVWPKPLPNPNHEISLTITLAPTSKLKLSP